jgi:branched-chain amino acid aminotransferase
MLGTVMIDGVLAPPERAVVSVYDRGFLYGDAIYEALRTYEGRPFALDLHLARLERSAERVWISLPVPLATIGAEVGRAIEVAVSSASPGQQWYVRLMLTRGSGPLGLDPNLASAPLRVVLVGPLTAPTREQYARGVALATVSTQRTTDQTSASGAKVSNYLANLLALREAKLRGANEAIIVDARGNVLEGATSNVFIVQGDELATPPESAGILLGVTRGCVLDAAHALGMRVRERTLTPHDLYAADEVFITSSTRELLPAVRVDGRGIGEGSPGAVVRALHRAFRERVGTLLGRRLSLPMPWEG